MRVDSSVTTAILDQHGIFKETELLTENAELHLMTRSSNNQFMKQLKKLLRYDDSDYGIRYVIDLIIYA